MHFLRSIKHSNEGLSILLCFLVTASADLADIEMAMNSFVIRVHQEHTRALVGEPKLS